MDKKWTCVCGKENEEDFCEACGTARPDLLSADSHVEEAHTADNYIEENDRADNKRKKLSEQTRIQTEEYLVRPAVKADLGNSPSRTPHQEEPEETSSPALVLPPSRPQNGCSRKMIVLGFVAVILCVLVGFGFKAFSSDPDTSAVSNYHHSVDKKPDRPKEKSQPMVKSDLSLGGMDLDETMQDMYNKLGKESYTKSADGRTYYYYKDSVRVGFTDSKVTSLVSDGTKASTKRGIHEGSTLGEVIDAYGDNASKFKYDNLDLYEYSAKSLAGREGILRFAINAQGKVEYISVRIPQENKVDSQAVGNAAKDVIDSYHKYITKRDYKSAYNLLTDDMQNTMGLYEKWAQGFRNTIESRVTDLQVSNVQADSAEVSFILVARDRRPGGSFEENRFRSTATVVKTGSGWKIAGVNNKKI